MKWPFVARSTFDLVLADRDWYRAQYHAAIAPKPLPAPSALKATAKSDEEIVAEAEQSFIAKATEDLMRQHGLDRIRAEREAKRIREEVVTVTMHPGA